MSPVALAVSVPVYILIFKYNIHKGCVGDLKKGFLSSFRRRRLLVGGGSCLSRSHMNGQLVFRIQERKMAIVKVPFSWTYKCLNFGPFQGLSLR